MDAATTTLQPPRSSAPSAFSSSTSSSGSLAEPVSLRPGGGTRFSFRPNSGAVDSGSKGASGVASGAAPLFPLRQEKRTIKSKSELLRYTREELLGLKDDWTDVPEEIAGSDVQVSSTALDESARRGEVTPYPEQRAVEPDTRDWRGRNPLPAPPPEQEKARDPYRERPLVAKEGGRSGTGTEPRVPQQQAASPQRRVLEPSAAANNLPPGPIVKAASPWSARRGAQTEKDKVIKTVKGILNKLTPEKYDTLKEQLTQSGITSAEILQGVISLVFDKAVLEPTFCSMYSMLCVDLSKALPEFPATIAGDKPVTFRRVLLNTCQSEFEGADELRAEIRQLTAPEQELERLEKERNVKLRTLGNIKFIGELFKQKMIPEKIVHACIQELLGLDPKAIPAEENVEALCQLLMTVGKALDASQKSRVAENASAKSRDPVNAYFLRLKDLTTKKSLAPRIRFLVRDVLDVRSNNWVPRREEVKAKTIGEVHAEAEQNLGLRAGSASLKVGRSGSAAPGMLPGGGMMPGAPGSGRGMPGYPGQPGGMPGIPAGGLAGGFAPPGDGDGWESVGAARRTRRDYSTTAPLPTSAFARLPMRSGAVNPRVLSSALIGSSAPPPQAPTQASRNGPVVAADVAPRPAPTPPVAEVPAKVPAQESRPELSAGGAPPPTSQQRAQLTKKTESLLKEYFSIVDLKEALLCVKELGGPELHPQFVECILAVMFENTDRETELVSKLFDYLHAEKVLSSEAIRAGFLITAEQLEDLAMDAPLAPKRIGMLLAGLVLSNAADVGLLVAVSKKCEDEYLRGVVLGGMFQTLQSKSNEEQAVAVFRTLSKDDLSLFGDKTQVAKTLERAGLGAAAASL